MKKVVAIRAPKPRVPWTRYVAWIYAATVIFMVVLQLFAFEDFTPLISHYLPASSTAMGAAVAGFIVFFEVFSVPFLLRMTLSPLMRWFSLVCSIAVASGWLKLSVLAIISGTVLENSGLLGAKIILPSGVFALFVSLLLLVFALVSAWGLWPAVKQKNK